MCGLPREAATRPSTSCFGDALDGLRCGRGVGLEASVGGGKWFGWDEDIGMLSPIAWLAVLTVGDYARATTDDR